MRDERAPVSPPATPKEGGVREWRVTRQAPVHPSLTSLPPPLHNFFIISTLLILGPEITENKIHLVKVVQRQILGRVCIDLKEKS